MYSFSKPLPPPSISNFLSWFSRVFFIFGSPLFCLVFFSLFCLFLLNFLWGFLFYLSIWNFFLAITAWFPTGRLDKNKTLNTDHEGPILLCMGHMPLTWVLTLWKFSQHRREPEMQAVEPSNAKQRDRWQLRTGPTGTLQAFWLRCEEQKWRKFEAVDKVSVFLFWEIGLTEACSPVMAVAGVTNWLLYCHLLFGWQTRIGPQNMPPLPSLQLELGVGEQEARVDEALHMVFGTNGINPNDGSWSIYRSSLEVLLEFCRKGLVDFHSVQSAGPSYFLCSSSLALLMSSPSWCHALGQLPSEPHQYGMVGAHLACSIFRM